MDWDLFYLCQDNPFYKSQLEALLRAPAEEEAKAREEAVRAAQAALRVLRETLRLTCRRYRKIRRQRTSLHRNRFPLHLQVKAQQAANVTAKHQQYLVDSKKWQRFLISVTEYRCHQAASWTAREDLPMVTGQIWSQEPYNLVETWPEGSQCPIDPQPVVYTVPNRNVIPKGNASAEVFNTDEVAASRAKDESIYYDRVEKWMKANMHRFNL